MKSLLLVLWCGVSVAALFTSTEKKNSTYSKTFVDAVSWAIQDQIFRSCSFTLLISDDAFSIGISSHIRRFLDNKQLPYQVGSIAAERMEEDQIIWRIATCDVYLIIAQNLLHHPNFLDRDDASWNWVGRYFFLSENVREDLEVLSGWYKLQKTHDAVFFIKEDKDKEEVTLFTHLLFRDEKLKFLTLWRDGAPSSTVDLFPDKVRNLFGRRIRVFTFNHAPSVFSVVDSLGFLRNVSGIDVEVVSAIGQALNFTPVFEHPGPARWGTILPNGTHTGMIGRISRDEAEVGVGNVFVTEVRARYITFTIPYDYERACFITPSPRELPRWLAITFPFSLNVWILLIGTMLVLSVFVPFFAMGLVRRDRGSLHNISSSFLIVLGQFCNQATLQPRRSALQVLFGAIILTGFVVTVFYSSNLTAYMMVRAVEPPYTSIQQIVKAGYEVGGFSDFWRAIFEGSSNENVKKLGQKFFSFFPDITPHLKRVVARDVVLLENTQHLEYLQKNFFTDRKGESPLRLMLEECINPFGIGALLKRNSPLKSSVDMAILHMREGGLVDKFFDMVLQVDHKDDHEDIELGFNPDEAISDESDALTIQHLQGAFLLLAIGYSVAVFALATEVAFSACKGNVKA